MTTQTVAFKPANSISAVQRHARYSPHPHYTLPLSILDIVAVVSLRRALPVSLVPPVSSVPPGLFSATSLLILGNLIIMRNGRAEIR
jgi:hypothetical protein